MSGVPTTSSISREPLRTTLAGVALLCAFAGCGEGPKAEFAWRESTTQLILPARKALQKVITDDFGTPHDLVGWERMPVNYGGVKAEVATVERADTMTLTVAEDEPPGPVYPKASVVWLTGARAGGKFADLVDSFDPKTRQLKLKLTASATEPPAVGDKLIAGFGGQLQLGRVVYMKNCLHCHGVAGDGAGPTATYLNPRPRDFRLGVIKFTSTQPPERAARDDLYRTISYGLPGTYMPSFLLMAEEEKLAVIEYVRWLAMRGELEKRLGDELADYNAPSIEADAKQAKADYDAAVKAGEKPERPVSVREAHAAAVTSFAEYEKDEFPGIVDETADFIAEQWTKADEPDSVLVPKSARVADTKESRQRGRQIYLSNRAKCYQCHGPLGRGDGANVEDFWPRLDNPNERYAERGLHDQWGHILQPRDLTKGQYRGGRRPLDLYRRIFAGIKGTPMPASGTVLKDEEIWDLVNFVMSIPFEPQTPSMTKPAALASAPPRLV